MSEFTFLTGSEDWWRQAVVYQIYPRSFADANGDGIGDLKGIISRVPYLKALGIDAVWLSPHYPSALADGGYDVDDYRNVDPRLGTLAEFDEMIDALHAEGIRVIIDIVPNHSGSGHVWFQEALRSPKGSPARDRYIFRDGKGENGEIRPSELVSHFGPTAWTRITEPDGTPGQWYMHLFAPEQPDFNWDNPEVREDFLKTLRFWSDRGVDGYRVDVAHALVKNLANGHLPERASYDLSLVKHDGSDDLFDRDEVHDIYRSWRKVFNEYNPPRMAVAEAWVHPPVNATRYVRSDELHQVFNFDLLDAAFNAQQLYGLMSAAIDLMKSVGALPTWALSNHDSPRVASRIGEVQSRALALFVLALPGSCYVYAGQELGLPDGVIPDEARQDPIYFRTKGTQKGRDGARVPLPWSGEAAPFGFTSGSPWLPLQESWKELTVEKQDTDPKSSLNLYRSALNLRAEHLVDNGEVQWIESPEHGRKNNSLLAFKRGNVSIYMNLSDTPIEVEVSGKLLVVSAGIVDGRDGKVTIPPVSTIWLHH